MKVAAYVIAKNEEKNVDNFLATVKDFDEVIVVDTGSTDKTVSLLRQAGIRVIERVFESFDFSEARNYSLAQVSEDIEWCFSIDFNEYLVSGWKERFANALALSPLATAFWIVRYDDHNGEVQKGSENKLILHRREMYLWKYAVHEVIAIREEFVEKLAQSDIVITKKIQRMPAKEDFYATICLREYRKNSNQNFYLWFLIGYFYDRHKWQQTIEYGLRYLETTASVKSDFRVHTCIKISRASYELGDAEQSFRYGMLGFSEALFFPEDPIFGHAVDHMLRYALIADQPALFVFMTSFVKQSSQELQKLRKEYLRRLSR
jgi:glycosyltransferase involved in cell wall biosynthesis